jgi:nondiscriminating glutamyl-tRNA synthetase
MENKIETKEIRTRFAPSPTGELHIGGLKTALNCYLIAKQAGGKFILRVEDTDQSRLVEGAAERMVKALEWANVKPDEGVILNGDNLTEIGDFGPYTQSKRLDIYKKYADKLLVEKKAYRCFCSSERLDRMRIVQQKNKQAPKYDRTCLSLSEEEVQQKIDAGEKYVLRFKIPEGYTTFKDGVFGKISVKNDTLDDLIIMKSDGFPTYHLAVVVDDYLMKISHVARGAEWLPSTPKHILLYEALGWGDKIPQFVHMASILNKSGKKLSKREGSVSVKDFREQGYPVEGLINFIALLGWNPKTEQEIFTLEELVEQFDISKMNKAGGVFDLDRLDWISSQHIKKMSVDVLYERGLEFLEQQDFYKTFLKNTELSEAEIEEYLKKILSIEQDRLSKFTEIGVENQFFFKNADSLEFSLDDIRWKDNPDKETLKCLKEVYETLEKIPEDNWTQDFIQEKLLALAGEKRGDYLFPLRWVLSGQQKSPSPFEISWALGREETLKRIKSILTIK